MTQDAVLRRLSAILAADVVGYSRLMAADETNTLTRFRQIRANVIDPAIAQFQGRIVGTAGDSLLVEFTNALAAVQCAVTCQTELNRSNAAEPEDRRIVFRMGVNLGDVIAADDTIHGDGVNVAARLEKLAEPGGLCIARNVYEQVQSKLELSFTDLGEHQVKNITQPIRVYRAEMANEARPVTATGGDNAKEPTRSEKVSIAVLPFDNMSGDPEQGYFSDGITEDIITELSQFRSLLVIARNSSFQYRHKATDVRRIARDLGVQFLVEGSVRKVGNSVRITAQLIEAGAGNHLWAERYDRPLDQIFAVQDEVVQKIAARLEGRLAATIAREISRKPTQNMQAYECVLRAREHLGTFDWSAAEPLLRHAITLDPDYAQAHAWLAASLKYRFFLELQVDFLDQSLTHATRAVTLDDSDGWCHSCLAATQTFRREFDAAGIHFERALALNPTNISIVAHYCRWLTCMGQPERALAGLDESLVREPFPPSWHWEVRAIALMAARRYQDAIDAIARMSRLHDYIHAYLATCYAHLGHHAEAQAKIVEVLKMNPRFSIHQFMLSEPFKNPADAQHEIDGMRKAGLPE